jgi:hypothetical protein
MIETLDAPRVAPVEPRSPLRLSEALRLGSLDNPQCKRHLYDFGTGGYCALGAIYKAVGWEPTVDESRAPQAQRAEMTRVSHTCWTTTRDAPCEHATYFRHGASIHVLLIHLNDDHEWTREKIADWLESEGL